ncbi:MAG TPA: CAP domain-containing protein [Phycisphaerae bacterium]|nr:CAP domain-containing protein [Phycisphaerae bacterium]
MAALVIAAGCGPSGPALPPLPSATGTSDQGVFDVDLLNSRAGPPCAGIGQPASLTHQQLFEALNQYRVENGLRPLFYSQALEEAADDQARDLWVRGFFSHTNPDGESPGDRALEAGFCHRYVGENIAAGHTSVEQVMQAWKDSPGHNANMLDPDFVYVGMGYSFDARGRQYWAQEFAFDVP